ncbi:riboflavin biosynthesis protein RibD domain-containing protein [Coniochaeta sp. 2T2.1]|nr:riboflavin biosynthesis protein RibD domain-containing protein [Coniochaeta sp. 2T2.1]
MSQPLHFPPSSRSPLEPYLPPTAPSTTTTSSSLPESTLPHLTLTFATSLDSAISLSPGVQTVLSGPESKAMTHYLRSRHAAILVGAGTAVADDPGLNCRIEGCEGLENQPRPVVLDPRGRWEVGSGSKVIELAKGGRGLGPYVLVGEGTEVDEERKGVVESVGGKYVSLKCRDGEGFSWRDVLGVLKKEGLESVMVEGGGRVINSLLEGANLELVSSVIVTIAPVWLGRGGVVVSPQRHNGGMPAARLGSVKWCPLGEDVVLCGRPLLGGS